MPPPPLAPPASGAHFSICTRPRLHVHVQVIHVVHVRMYRLSGEPIKHTDVRTRGTVLEARGTVLEASLGSAPSRPQHRHRHHLLHVPTERIRDDEHSQHGEALATIRRDVEHTGVCSLPAALAPSKPTPPQMQ